MYWKNILFLVIDSTLASDNPLRFGNNLSDFKKKGKTNHGTINDNVKDENLPYNIKREVAKISALSYHQLKLAKMNIL